MARFLHIEDTSVVPAQGCLTMATGDPHLKSDRKCPRVLPARSPNSCRAVEYQASMASPSESADPASRWTCSYDGGGLDGPLGRSGSTFGGRTNFLTACLLASPRKMSLEGECGFMPASSNR